jgi:hypothetical protein
MQKLNAGQEPAFRGDNEFPFVYRFPIDDEQE